jgi:hypothetical protein
VVLDCVVLDCVVLDCVVLDCVVLGYVVLGYVVLGCVVVDCVVLGYVVLDCVVLDCVVLDCVERALLPACRKRIKSRRPPHCQNQRLLASSEQIPTSLLVVRFRGQECPRHTITSR